MAAKLLEPLALEATPIVDRILEAAEAILEGEGLHALTIRRLAAEAEVAPMSIYHHLGSKEGVVDLLLRQAFRRLELAMREVAGVAHPVDAYRLAGQRYRELALRAPATYALMFSGRGLASEVGEATTLACLASLDALVAICQRLVDAGIARSSNALDLARSTWAAVHGAVTLELAGFTEGEASYLHLTELVEAGAIATPR